MKKGVRFLIPNKYGKYIAEVLEVIDCTKYVWSIVPSDTDISKIVNGKFGDELFVDYIIAGNDFVHLINKNIYYAIFAKLNAFSKGVPITEFDNYEDFVDSNCEICMLIVDSSYVDVYCKDVLLIEKIYNNAQNKEYERIEYIGEDDNRRRLAVW